MTSTSQPRQLGTTAQPLTGAALIAHAERYIPGGSRSAMVREAGYATFNPDGSERLQFIAFYEALLDARNNRAASAPTPTMRAWFALPDGEQVGPCLPIIAANHETAWFGERELETVCEWSDNCAREILAGILGDDEPQGPAAVVMISDRDGADTLLEVTAQRWETPTGPRWSFIISKPSAGLPDGVEECAHCGALTTEGESDTVSGLTACSACHDDATPCDQCGERFDSDDLITTADGLEVCSSCLDRHYSRCDATGDHYPDAEIVTVYGGGVWHEGRTLQQINRALAEELREDGRLWFDCDGDYTAEPPDDEEEDIDQEPPYGVRMHPYGTCPNDWHSHRMPETLHRFGAEIEYKGSHPEGVTLAAAMGADAILTADSTVSGEIVTTCQTAGQLRRTLARIAPALQPTSNDGRTGLHFHADRRQLTPWQWHRLTLYCQTMADTLETITGRDCHDYGSLRNVVARDWPTFARFWRSANGPRYVGFNITRHTVEFRACRSSKTTHRLLARFALYRRLIALGRLPDSAKPDANELRGWLAWDPDIRKETGWQPDTWNYRAAARMQPIPSDLPPWERLTPEEQRARQLATLQIRAIEQALRVLNDRSAVVFRQYLRANAAADRHTAAGMARILRARIADSATDQAIWRLQRERNRHQATLDNPEILTQ